MTLLTTFPKAADYLTSTDILSADDLDKAAKALIESENLYEKASQALRRRFARGAEFVEGIDRERRLTKIKRDKDGGTFKYMVEGKDGSWSKPDERIWVVAMYYLWQTSK